MSEVDALLKAFGEAGGDKGALAAEDTAHLVASGHKLLSIVSPQRSGFLTSPFTSLRNT